MKSKLIITNVDCIYEHASDFPRTFFIELTPDIQRRIKQLSMLVKLSEVYNIEEFHSCGFWSNSESDILRSKQASTNDIRSTLAQHQTNVE
ncbi:MAG: hypothetical protein OEZ58_16850, partial [Gammaproteobacteria bacterium]|nr:hypothetical protein [Gammaproteobacteria bacterium]